jgi:DcmR-like sensory protein
MSVRDHVSRSHARTAHFVQFFDSEETRHEAVASFLAEGYLSGSPLIVIARPLNSQAILNCLEQTGASIPQDLASGRITVLDAAQTLKRISRTGSPDAGAFDDAVGALVTRVARRGRIFAYGEMVDILAQRGDLADAVLLEELWNRLLTRTPVSLLCGYSAAHFVSPGTQGTLRDICAAHADVRVETQDPLAAWLLDQAL